MTRILAKLPIGLLAIAFCLSTAAAVEPVVQLGPSKLPLPRFVTLKSAKVNVRQGPGLNYEVSWIFTKPGLPVEVIQEFETWRRIRDSEGATGWVSQGLLSGKRNAVVVPWEKSATQPIRSKPSEDAPVISILESGVLAEVKSCQKNWCRLADKRFDGWIKQDRLWGVYPGESVD